MRELGLALLGSLGIFGFFGSVIYPDLEVKNHPRVHGCTGECYEKYVAEYGTTVEQLIAKREEAAGDPFSSIKPLWSGCAACHGNEGQGIGAFPRLAGQSSDYIIGRLNQYKNRETVGAMSQTMWGQAGMLSDQDIKLLGEYIEETYK